MAGSFEPFPGMSGKMAAEENERATGEIERDLEDLRRRATLGERVDGQIRNLQARADRLREDKSGIAEGGM